MGKNGRTVIWRQNALESVGKCKKTPEDARKRKRAIRLRTTEQISDLRFQSATRNMLHYKTTGPRDHGPYMVWPMVKNQSVTVTCNYAQAGSPDGQ
jgi:hypothetical protein